MSEPESHNAPLEHRDRSWQIVALFVAVMIFVLITAGFAPNGFAAIFYLIATATITAVIARWVGWWDGSFGD